MSLTATLLFKQPFILPDGKLLGAANPPRRKPRPVSVYRQQQAQGRADNLNHIVDAIAAGYSSMMAIAMATDLSLSMVKKAVKVLEAERRIMRADGHSRPHLYRVAR